MSTRNEPILDLRSSPAREKRMDFPCPHIIFNPSSGAGKTELSRGRILQEIERLLDTSTSFVVTNRPLKAVTSAANAITHGCDLVIAVGGDGTINEVVNGLFSNGRPINSDCRLGIISSGTGNGFAQSVGIPDSLNEQINVALFGSSRPVDVGKVTFLNPEGTTGTRYFVNECQIGIGGAVVQRVQKKYKKLGGTIGFGAGTVETVFRYPNQFLALSVDGTNTVADWFTGIVVANGAFTGGGMNLAPSASLDDGAFNLLMMRKMSVAARLSSFPKIYSGEHIHLKHYTYTTVRALSIESPENVLIAADGELLGTTPCTIEIVPASLQVQCIAKRI